MSMLKIKCEQCDLLMDKSSKRCHVCGALNPVIELRLIQVSIVVILTFVLIWLNDGVSNLKVFLYDLLK